jgi:hypothetical protein
MERTLDFGPTSQRSLIYWVTSNPVASLSSASILMRMNLSIGIVDVFWSIAVVPLLIHRNDLLSAALKRFISKQCWETALD